MSKSGRSVNKNVTAIVRHVNSIRRSGNRIAAKQPDINLSDITKGCDLIRRAMEKLCEVEGININDIDLYLAGKSWRAYETLHADDKPAETITTNSPLATWMTDPYIRPMYDKIERLKLEGKYDPTLDPFLKVGSNAYKWLQRQTLPLKPTININELPIVEDDEDNEE